MRTRLISSAVLVPPVVAALWLGGLVWAGLLAVAAVLVSVEGVQLLRATGCRPSMPVCAALAAGLVLAARLATPEMVTLVLVAGVMAAFVDQLARAPAQRSALDWAGTVALPAYVGSLLGFAVRTREIEAGLAWSAVLLLLVWTNDSVAFLAGRRWGRRPLAPTISPQKTIEGAAVATLATILAAGLAPGVIAHLSALADPTGHWSVPAFVGLGLAVSVAAPLGDLSKSLLKRSAGVKDSGWLVPGHGGLLDRTDSLMFAAPVVYLFARMLQVWP